MSFETPNVDETNFSQLMEVAKRYIRQHCPNWTDLNPSDPGIVLVELFAYMTELMIYKLNQLPKTANVEFLKLLGTRLVAPSAASVQLEFSLEAPRAEPVKIPKGTQVAASRGSNGAEPPIFLTNKTMVIEPGKLSVSVTAHHCTYHEAELVKLVIDGRSCFAQLANFPVINFIDAESDLVLAVQVKGSESELSSPLISFQGKHYHRWTEVDHFLESSHFHRGFVVDRMSGKITFPRWFNARHEGTNELNQHMLRQGMIPRSDAEIRVWYRTGGGTSGNVAAGSLSVMKDVIPGLTVTNPKPAIGGRNGETIENAMMRGPHEFYAMGRAVTAQDYEAFATSIGGIARAKAKTKASKWKYARPGTVEVLLVPFIDEEGRGEVLTRQVINEYQQENVRLMVENRIKDRQPLGATCHSKWVSYKSISISARVAAFSGEDLELAKSTVLGKLNRLISPATVGDEEWGFGKSLRLSTVYDCISANGKRQIDQIRMRVDDGAPSENVECMCVDPHHPNVIYAGSNHILYRSLNGGEGWEPVKFFAQSSKITAILGHPEKPGLLALVLLESGVENENTTSRIWISRECGESWELVEFPVTVVHDIAWSPRKHETKLYVANDLGLHELFLGIQHSYQIIPIKGLEIQGLYAVTTSHLVGDAYHVVVSAQGKRGVYLSVANGRGNAFSYIGLKDEDVRYLTTHHHNGVTYLWAGLTHSKKVVSRRSCLRRKLPDASEWEFDRHSILEEWLQRHWGTHDWLDEDRGWVGESCNAVAFVGETVFAATHSAGIISKHFENPDSSWEVLDPKTGGWPVRGQGERLFVPVRSLTYEPQKGMLFASGKEGIFVRNQFGRFKSTCKTEFTEFADLITLPDDMLFCSGLHEITVVSQDEE